jgi:chitin synthase
MTMLGLKRDFQIYFFTILAGLIHLGNVEFEHDLHKKQEAAFARNQDVLEISADLLGVPPDALEAVLTSKVIVVKDSEYTDFLSPPQAHEMRNRLISSVFSCLFSYIIDLVNRRLSKDDGVDCFIGVVNMGGLQAPSSSSLHQLCRNYAAERIHLLQVQQIERDFNSVSSKLNIPPATLIKDSVPLLIDNIYDVLHNVLKTINANNANSVQPNINKQFRVELLDDMHKKFGGHPKYSYSREDSSTGFSIYHSLGSVNYSLTALLQQLNNNLAGEFINLFRNKCINILLQQAFGENRITTVSNPKKAKTIMAGRSRLGTATRATWSRSRAGTSVPTAVLREKIRQGKLNPQLARAMHLGLSSDELKQNNGNDEGDGHVNISRLSGTALGHHRWAIDELIESIQGAHIWTLLSVPELFIREELVKSLNLPGIVAVQKSAPYIWNDALVDFAFYYSDLLGVDVSIPDEVDKNGNLPNIVNGNTITSSLKNKNLSPLIMEGSVLALKDLEWLTLEYLSAKQASLFAKAEGESPRSIGKVSMILEREGGDMSGTTDTNLVPDKKQKKKESAKPKAKMTSARFRWLVVVYFFTWWLPDCFIHCCGSKALKSKDVRLAWREKLALCIIIGYVSAIMLFMITGLGKILCPAIDMYTVAEFRQEQRGTIPSAWLRYQIHGGIYDVTGWKHPNSSDFSEDSIYVLRGWDISPIFPRWNTKSSIVPNECMANPPTAQSPINLDGMSCTVGFYTKCHDWVTIKSKMLNAEMKMKKVANIAFSLEDIKKSVNSSNLFSFSGKVFNATDLLLSTSPYNSEQRDILRINIGSEMSSADADRLNLACLEALAYVGVVDTRNPMVCNVSSYILLAMMYTMVALMVVKFLSAYVSEI